VLTEAWAGVAQRVEREPRVRIQQEDYGRETLTAGRRLDFARTAEAVLRNCLRYQREKLLGSEKPSSDATSDNVRPVPSI